ncbi:hypothetical protein CRG98_041806 [Punica granatum]|uniref:Uncharacterized protein n=1 Tax=Punica granatum TaxID=22663 RepID=A0A2I0I1G2_PUNGR|nr:hypothetical protein CRG98_041806 [Punica granatum]
MAPLQGLFIEFDEVMLYTADLKEQQNQRDKMKAIICLQSLEVEYEHVRSQILSGEAIPPLANVIARLIRVTDVSQTPCTVKRRRHLLPSPTCLVQPLVSLVLPILTRAIEHPKEERVGGIPQRALTVADAVTVGKSAIHYMDFLLRSQMLLSKLTKSLNCIVTFASDSVMIKDSRTGGTIGTGHEFQGLYRLSTPVTSEFIQTFGVVFQFLQVKVIVIS